MGIAISSRLHRSCLLAFPLSALRAISLRAFFRRMQPKTIEMDGSIEPRSTLVIRRDHRAIPRSVAPALGRRRELTRLKVEGRLALHAAQAWTAHSPTSPASQIYAVSNNIKRAIF
jgi:hypothetical protein